MACEVIQYNICPLTLTLRSVGHQDSDKYIKLKPPYPSVERGRREALLRYTIVHFGRQKVLFGKRGKLVIKKKGGPRHSSYN